jgi:hypothetical protein
MNKTELASQRNPESDRLFRCTPESGDPVYIRIRLLEVPGESTFANKVDRDVITVQLQSSIAADETGDVARDVDAVHLIMSPSRHTIQLDAVVAGALAKGEDPQAAVDAVIARLVDDEVTKAYHKALVRRVVVSRLAKMQAAPTLAESAQTEAASSETPAEPTAEGA